jgi:outer membrane protein TolC
MDAAILKALSDNAREEKEVYQKQLANYERRAKLGAARNLDLRRAQYLVAKAESDYELKRQDFLRKMGELGNKIGTQDFFQLGSVSIESPHLNNDPMSLVAMARSTSDINVLTNEISSSQSAILAERLDFLPKFKLTLDSGWPFLTDKNPLVDRGPFFVKMMFNVEIPLFTGGSSLATLKSLHAQKSIKEFSLQSKLDEKRLSINGLLEQYKNLQQVKLSAQLAVEAAMLAKESADRMFEKNEATGLEITEAQTNHFTAKNLLATTSLRLEQAKLRLLFVIGRAKDLIEPVL